MTIESPGCNMLSGGEKNRSLARTTTPPLASAARSNGTSASHLGSGTATPCTRSRATPPSG
jgi:hypothetical protein